MPMSRMMRTLPPALLLLSAAAFPVLADDVPIHSETTSSGLGIEYTAPKTCKRPTEKGDDILVNYRGTLQSTGNEFDSSYSRGVPFSFGLGTGQVIKGWDQGLMDMCVGEKRRLIVPPGLGYGNRRVGPIPAGSILVFDTELMGVVGVDDDLTLGHEQTGASSQWPDEDEVSEEDQQEEGMAVGLPSADVPPVNVPAAELADPVLSDEEVAEKLHEQENEEQGIEDGPLGISIKKNDCRLLGPFALLVQGALGALALLSLVFKRWRERPRRPLQIWFFDVSKQVMGTFLLHLANLAMSMFSSGDLGMAAQHKEMAEAIKHGNGRTPNPCSFYLLNLAIDTTIGIPVLIVLLKVFHALFQHTPLANPPESIRSGHYGTPPRFTWWMKQSLIYFLGLLGMKLFVFFLFQVLPWIGWVGDWALRWTEGNEALQIAFVMFIFPVLMNAIQYYIVDGIIKDRDQPENQGFERVAQEDSQDGDSRRERGSVDSIDGERDPDEAKKGTVTTTETLEEANPTTLPAYDNERDGEASSSKSKRK